MRLAHSFSPAIAALALFAGAAAAEKAAMPSLRGEVTINGDFVRLEIGRASCRERV